MDAIVRNYLNQYSASEAVCRFLAKPKRMFIDGEWIAGGNMLDVTEPSTGGVITQIPLGTVVDLDSAVDAARRQFDGGPWRQMKPLERERLLSSPFIVSPDYGTRCSTVVAMRADGHCILSETTYDPQGIAIERHDWPYTRTTRNSSRA